MLELKRGGKGQLRDIDLVPKNLGRRLKKSYMDFKGMSAREAAEAAAAEVDRLIPGWFEQRCPTGKEWFITSRLKSKPATRTRASQASYDHIVDLLFEVREPVSLDWLLGQEPQRPDVPFMLYLARETLCQHKIGISQDPAQRLRGIKYEQGISLELVATRPLCPGFMNARKFEELAHNKAIALRDGAPPYRGKEYFRITHREGIECLDHAYEMFQRNL